MIIKTHAKHEQYNDGSWFWKGLVRCDFCGKERFVRLKDLRRGLGVKACRQCSNTGARHHRLGTHHTTEAKKKISDAKIGVKIPLGSRRPLSSYLRGNKHPMFGKHWSAETRKKNSLAHIGLQTGENNPMFGRRGEKSPHWKVNKPRDKRIRRREIEGYDEWRSKIFKRDNWTCQITGIKGGKIVAHHLYNYKDYPESRTDVNNGVTSDKSLHELFHKIYGKRYNTPEQWYQFRQSILNSYC